MGKSVTDIPFDPDRIDDDSQGGALPGRLDLAPLETIEVGDSLKTSKYAHALANFIGHCDTPITVGVQGEWGSGKTTL